MMLFFALMLLFRNCDSQLSQQSIHVRHFINLNADLNHLVVDINTGWVGPSYFSCCLG